MAGFISSELVWVSHTGTTGTRLPPLIAGYRGSVLVGVLVVEAYVGSGLGSAPVLDKVFGVARNLEFEVVGVRGDDTRRGLLPGMVTGGGSAPRLDGTWCGMRERSISTVFPTKVECDAQCRDDKDGDSGSGFVREGCECERDEHDGGGGDGGDKDRWPCAGFVADAQMSNGDEREDEQGDGTADRRDRAEVEPECEDDGDEGGEE